MIKFNFPLLISTQRLIVGFCRTVNTNVKIVVVEQWKLVCNCRRLVSVNICFSVAQNIVVIRVAFECGSLVSVEVVSFLCHAINFFLVMLNLTIRSSPKVLNFETMSCSSIGLSAHCQFVA